MFFYKLYSLQRHWHFCDIFNESHIELIINALLWKPKTWHEGRHHHLHLCERVKIINLGEFLKIWFQSCWSLMDYQPSPSTGLHLKEIWQLYLICNQHNVKNLNLHQQSGHVTCRIETDIGPGWKLKGQGPPVAHPFATACVVRVLSYMVMILDLACYHYMLLQ